MTIKDMKIEPGREAEYVAHRILANHRAQEVCPNCYEYALTESEPS